jgi:hypothetical protein
VEAQDPEPVAGRRRWAGRAAAGRERVVLGRASDREEGQAGSDVGVGEGLLILSGRADRAEHRQAAPGVAVLLQVLPDHGLQRLMVSGSSAPWPTRIWPKARASG